MTHGFPDPAVPDQKRHHPPAIIRDAEESPAMAALTPRQRLFVTHWLANGGLKAYQIIIDLGWSNPELTEAQQVSSARVTANRFLNNPKVQLALREFTTGMLAEPLLASVAVISEIMNDPTHKDRLKAAIRIQELAGFVVKTQHEVTVTRIDQDTMVREIKDMAQQLGMSETEARRLLGTAGIVDAEFTEVSTEPQQTEEALGDW